MCGESLWSIDQDTGKNNFNSLHLIMWQPWNLCTRTSRLLISYFCTKLSFQNQKVHNFTIKITIPFALKQSKSDCLKLVLIEYLCTEKIHVKSNPTRLEFYLDSSVSYTSLGLIYISLYLKLQFHNKLFKMVVEIYFPLHEIQFWDVIVPFT